MEAKRSAIAGPQGRQQPGRSWAGWQVGPLFVVEVINKPRASARASQPGSGQADGQLGPQLRADVSNKPRASARVSQPGSGQAGGQDGHFVAVSKQGNGVTASSSLWQSGV